MMSVPHIGGYSVHREVFSTLGDTNSTYGDILSTWGMFSTSGDIMIYGGISCIDQEMFSTLGFSITVEPR